MIDDVPPMDLDPPAPADKPWHERLLRSEKSGRLVASHSNALLILEHSPDVGGVLAFDEHAYRVLVTRRPPWAASTDTRAFPAEMSDQLDVARCTEWFQATYQTAWAKKTIAEAMVDVSYVFRFDSVRQYLESLEWDGEKDRCDTWLTTYGGVADTPLNRAFQAKFLISMVARVLDPGCKADCILVLEGDQGFKKSTALEVLAGEWFKDEILSMDDQRQAAEMIQGVWLFEIAEFASFKGKANEKIKAFSSRRVDRYRPYYGTTSIARKRRTVFAVTVNPDKYLTDETGNRRYWPLKVTRKINVEGLRHVRDQLFAEAVARYRSGEPWWLETTELEHLAAQAVDERFESDIWDERLEPWLDDRIFCTTSEALVQLGFKFDELKEVSPQAQQRVARILRRHGREQVRRHPLTGEIGRYWVYRQKTAEYRRRKRRGGNADTHQLSLFAA